MKEVSIGGVNLAKQVFLLHGATAPARHFDASGGDHIINAPDQSKANAGRALCQAVRH